MHNNDDHLHGIDLNELFNEFNASSSIVLSRIDPLRNNQSTYDKNNHRTKTDVYSSRSSNDDELIELNENDCTAPRTTIKSKVKVNSKQMTMYDYASSVSYKHQRFYSSLDNTITAKTIVKRQKRPLNVIKSYVPI
jgi:hypothetical protein